jgi:hypothetical protein
MFTQANKYKIKKFCKLADNKGYLNLPISKPLKTKKTQKATIKTMCQNFNKSNNIT